MRFRWMILWSVVLTVVFSACARKLDPEPACNFVQNGDLQRVSWNDQTPIKFYVDKSFPLDTHPEMQQVIRDAAAAWNQVAGREVIRIQAFYANGGSLPKKDGYSMLYWMNTWEAGKSREQARTTIYWSGSQIYESDIRVNAKDHYYYVGDDDSFSGVDFKSLIVHEFGHALGLAHTAIAKSVMNVTLSNGVDRREISKDDANSLRCEY